MSVFFYEPFYDLERIADSVFSDAQRNAGQVERKINENAVKFLKPRFSHLQLTFLTESLTFSLNRMDLHENPETNLVTATFEFPGVAKENIQINVHNGKLTVSAETKESEEHSENGYAVRERRYGKYSRTLHLPQGVKVCTFF